MGSVWFQMTTSEQQDMKTLNKWYLKSINTVAGIRKISLQAINFKMFCWLDPSLSRRFLMNIRLLGPIDCKRGKKDKNPSYNSDMNDKQTGYLIHFELVLSVKVSPA